MKELKGFLPVLIVVVAVLAGIFFSYPQYNSYKDANAALDAAQKQNDKLKVAQSELNTFLASYNSNSPQVAEANRILPRRTDVEDVLANLDTFANASGVSLSGVAFNDGGLDPNGNSKLSNNELSYIEMTMSATGTYAQFRTFVSQLENNLRLMDIMTVNLSITEGQNNLSYRIKARAYYQK